MIPRSLKDSSVLDFDIQRCTRRCAALERELQQRYPFLAAADADRITRAYGTRAVIWLRTAQRWEDLGRAFGSGLSEAEVEYLRREEWAQTAEDILWRRSKLGLRLDAEEQAALAEYLG